MTSRIWTMASPSLGNLGGQLHRLDRSHAAPAKASVLTSTPRSMTLNPPAIIMLETMFLPISWTSPWTVPMTTVALVPLDPFGMGGGRRASEDFMASAASISSGRSEERRGGEEG